METVARTESTTRSLHRIVSLPVDLSEPIYEHYSLFKMGVQRDVLHYAELLAPIVKDLIAAKPERADWVLTSPPYHAIRSAANLLCCSTHDILKGTLPPTVAPSIAHIHHEQGFALVNSRGDYSMLSLKDRMASRHNSIGPITKNNGFYGRPVIFINDINVTGTQQREMQRYFDSIGAAAVCWLYIIEIEESIGRSEPQIEHSINNSTPLSISQFGRVLADEDIRYTSKCIWRLFAYTMEELRTLLGFLDDARKREILQMVTAEGRFTGDQLQAKMNLFQPEAAQNAKLSERSINNPVDGQIEASGVTPFCLPSTSLDRPVCVRHYRRSRMARLRHP